MLKGLRNRWRERLLPLRSAWLTRVWGHHVHPTARVSFAAFLDKTSGGVTIGAFTLIARGAVILTHDLSRDSGAPTHIGANCFVGVNAIVMPGVRIGDHVVVGAGAVVTRDVEPGCVVAGNPARVVRRVSTGPYGMILEPSR